MMENGRKKALILLNGSAGIGRAVQNTWTIVRKLAEHGYEPIVYPIIPGTDLISEKLIEDYDGLSDLILCSGGDGTLNHVIQGMMRISSKPALLYIPTGSTNDFGRTLGIPADFDKALDSAFLNTVFHYDVGALNGKYFNYIAAFGAFSSISYGTDQQLKNLLGYAAYIVNAFTGLDKNLHYSRHLRIEAEDFTEEGNYIFGAVLNTAYVAGFNVFKPAEVKLDDGKMEMLFIKTPETMADLQGIMTAFQKGQMDHPYITFKHISDVRIFSDENIAWTVDGEYGGTYMDTRIQVNRQAIAIHRPLQ